MRLNVLISCVFLGACASAPRSSTLRHMRSPIVTMSSQRPAPAPGPGTLAESVHLRCDDDRCPEGVGMLVWPGPPDEGIQRCTATLIGPDLVLTASHCLPPEARHTGASCAGTWMTFARSERRPAEWIACRGILYATDSPEESVLHTDLALARLVRRVDREPLSLAFAPVQASVIVAVVAVRPNPIYPSQHELSSRLCRVATQESAIEEFGDEAAQVGWLIDCPSYPGNSGAPVVDHRGRIRAVLHGGSGPIDRIAITSSLADLPTESIGSR